MVESEEESSDREVDMKSMMKTLVLITEEYNRGFKRPSFKGKYDRQEKNINYLDFEKWSLSEREEKNINYLDFEKWSLSERRSDREDRVEKE